MKKIRVGVIGLGVGRGHLGSYAKCRGVEILAVCDVQENLLDEMKRKYGISLAFTDYKKMLDVPELDAVSIATPNRFHAPMTICALKCGKHVLCEKPMALNSKEAERMLREAKKSRKKLMIHFNQRFTPEARSIKKCVDSGKLGEVYYVKAGWLRQMGVPMRESFTSKSLSGGGPLIDLGVHRLDFCLWVLGYPKAVSVSAVTYDKIAGPMLRKRGINYDVEDLAVAIIRLKNGATIFLETSWATMVRWRDEMYTQLFGTRGGLEDRWIDYKAVEMNLVRRVNGKFTLKALAATSVQDDAQKHFIDCIRGNVEPEASGQNGLEVMNVLDAIYKSSELGREVRVQ